ncbi:hypothetical protein ACUN24_24435 [Pedobacter sp. WC2501]|uniref:hypothetical protein n=1 Tax=Pedobacter sp. WC2501 TaxID=3461400 RepID=UPI0040459082
MLANSYTYNISGKVYTYHAFHSFKIIDLINDDCLKDYTVDLDFDIKLVGINSLGGSFIDFKITAISLPEEINDEISYNIKPFLTEYQNITNHLMLKLNTEGNISSIENLEELKQKWIVLRDKLIKLSGQQEIDEMRIRGDIEFGEESNYEERIKKSLFFKTLFPKIQNQFLENDALLEAHEVTSSVLPDLEIPVKVYFDLKDEMINLSTELVQDDFENIIGKQKASNPELEINSFFINCNSSYFLDASNYIHKAETIKIETLNGEDETIDHIIISRVL